MNTKSIIQTSANVIRITNLKRGDLYKRYSDSTYDDSVRYGIVKAISNNGEKTFIEAVEYKKSYSSLEADFVVISGEKDVAIFPASIEEIQDSFDGVVVKMEKEVIEFQKKIEDKKKAIAETQLLLSGELSERIQSAESKELTQGEYNEIKLRNANALSL